MKHRHGQRILVFVLLSLPVCLAYGQTDPAYIGAFRQNFSVSASFYQKFTALTHQINDSEEVNYRPNTPVGIGLGVNYKNYSLSGGIGFDFLRDKNRGKTKSMDFQYHYYGRKFIADVFFQNYKGFYVEDENDEEIFYHHPDIKVVQYGLHGQYVFNDKKFSYRAAFYQREKQLKSAGSFQLGGGVYYNRVSGDETLVINERNRLSNYQISITGGYAYTFVIRRDFFISIGLSAGVNIGAERIKDLVKDVEVSPSIFPRLSAGYNAHSWSVGVNAVVNRVGVSQAKGMELYFDTGRMNVSFIKRFDLAPKFLRNFKPLNH